jgi:hypothetical protein
MALVGSDESWQSVDRASANTSCLFALRRRPNGRPIAPVAPAIRILIAFPQPIRKKIVVAAAINASTAQGGHAIAKSAKPNILIIWGDGRICIVRTRQPFAE